MRIPRPSDELGLKITQAYDYARSKVELCDEFRGQVPFALPRLLEHGVEDVPYLIEERIAGRSLDRVLPDLEDEQREQGLRLFADAAIALTHIEIERPWIGEFFTEELFRTDSWPGYLRTRGLFQFERAAEALRRDVPGVNDIFARFVNDVARVGEVPLGLVHGDLFPGNVMVNEDLEITGIIDFGFSTLIGDQRVDLAGASCFIDVERPWTRPGDGDIVRTYLHEQVPDLVEVEELYTTYYAIFWAFTNEFGHKLYEWCVRTLGDAARRAGDA